MCMCIWVCMCVSVCVCVRACDVRACVLPLTKISASDWLKRILHIPQTTVYRMLTLIA